MGNINELFKIFYAYFYLVFDNTSELIEEAQRVIKKQQLQLREQIKQYEKNGKQYERQITKFNLALDDTTETGEIRILARRISEAEENIKTNYENLTKAKIEVERLNEQYAGNESMNAYYNVKDRIHKFFYKMNIEEQRDELVKIIRECLVTGENILIDTTGFIVFIFDMNNEYRFDKKLLEYLEKDQVIRYRMTGYQKTDRNTKLGDLPENEIQELSKLTNIKGHLRKEIIIQHFELSNERHKRRFKKYVNETGIQYDFSQSAQVITFDRVATIINIYPNGKREIEKL